jgi:hypothetical protein
MPSRPPLVASRRYSWAAVGSAGDDGGLHPDAGLPGPAGIVASISDGLLALDANILENAQFSDEATTTFCMRTRFETPIEGPEVITEALAGRAAALDAEFHVRPEQERLRALVMVSKVDHCLVDLLYRVGMDEMPIEIPLVVSNRTDWPTPPPATASPSSTSRSRRRPGTRPRPGSGTSSPPTGSTSSC